MATSLLKARKAIKVAIRSQVLPVKAEVRSSLFRSGESRETTRLFILGEANLLISQPINPRVTAPTVMRRKNSGIKKAKTGKNSPPPRCQSFRRENPSLLSFNRHPITSHFFKGRSFLSFVTMNNPIKQRNSLSEETARSSVKR